MTALGARAERGELGARADTADSTEPGENLPRLVHGLAKLLPMSGVLASRQLLTVTLTARGELRDLNGMLAARDEYTGILTRRFRGSGVIAALHRPDDNPDHLHVHALVVLPVRVPASRAVSIWIRLRTWQPKARRPMRKAQHLRTLTERDIARVLGHHLGLGRNATWLDLDRRVIASGSLRDLWLRAVSRYAPPGSHPPGKPLPADTAQLRASRAANTHAALTREGKHRCRWCGTRLDPASQRDALWCKRNRNCENAASRALVAARVRLGPEVDDWLALLEPKGYRRRWALRIAQIAIDLGIAPDEFSSYRALASAHLCQCGRPLADRLGSITCGRKACLRRRERAMRKRRKRSQVSGIRSLSRGRGGDL